MSWGPPGTGPIAPKWDAACAAVTTLAQELDRLEPVLRASDDDVENALVAEQVAARRRADERSATRGRAHRARFDRTVAEIGALPRPAGRAGVVALGAPAAVAPSGTAPGLLRIGAARFPALPDDAAALVPGTRNVEIRATPTQEERAIDVLWTVVLRRLLDVSPAMHRIVVLDATTLSGPLLDLARLPSVGDQPLVTFAQTEAEMTAALDRLRDAASRVYREVLQSRDRTIVGHNVAAASPARLPWTTVVLPHGYERLAASVVETIGLLAKDGPRAGTSFVVCLPTGHPAVTLADAVVVRLETQRSSVTDRELRLVADLQLDPSPAPVVARTIERVHQMLRMPTADEPMWSPDDAWTAYSDRIRSLQVDADQYDKDEAAAAAASVRESSALEATRDDRLYLVRSLQRRTRTVRTATRGLAEQMRFMPPPGHAAATDPVDDIEQHLATLSADVERVEELLMRANAAKLEADAERAEAADRHAWEQADDAKRRDSMRGVVTFVVAAGLTVLLWVWRAHSWPSVLLCLAVTSFLAGLTYVTLMMPDATRGVLGFCRLWSTAHHPDDLEGPVPAGMNGLRAATATAAVGGGLVAGGTACLAMDRSVAGAIAFAVVAGVALGVALWRASADHLQELQDRADRYTAVRPHRHGSRPTSRSSPPPPRG